MTASAGFAARRAGKLVRWCAAWLARSGHSTLPAILYRAAQSLAPQDLHSFAYAHALWWEGDAGSAEAVLDEILAVEPDHPEANNLAGVITLGRGRAYDARARFERALANRPGYPAALNNLGNVFREVGDFAEAIARYRDALASDPEYVEALTNLGAVLNLQGGNDDAERFCRKAVELAPRFAGAHCNLGNVLLSLHRSGEALACYREAIRLQPDLPEALINLALLTEDPGYLVGTIEYYRHRIADGASTSLPHVRIAQAYQAMKRWDEARECLGKALESWPEDPELLFRLGVNLLLVGDAGAAVESLRRALEIRHSSAVLACIAFYSLYLEGCTGARTCELAREWADAYAARAPAVALPAMVPDAERRLRVGYLSKDFARHSVAYFLAPILRHHDRGSVETYCYSTLIGGDDFTDRFRTSCSAWRDISLMSEDRIVDQIREDAIDILIDLSGHTTGGRLGVFARKPAPVQVSYLGHPATTGVAAIDYRIGDAITDPEGRVEGHYVETLWRLPGCFLTYEPLAESPPVKPPPRLTTGHIVFGSFNNPAKINARVVAVWARVLSAVPGSRILLKGAALSSERGKARVLDLFSLHGIGSDRIELIDWRPDVANHLDLYGEIDIALDTFPYNGTTTTCEAMWMGVPVVCLEGERHSGRVGATLLDAVGLPELLAKDEDAFVDIATGLAGDVARLQALRAGLRERMRASRLLDHAAFTRDLEAAYRDMWRIHCRKRKGEAVPVEAGGMPA